MTSLSYFSRVPEVRFFVSNSLFGVEFVDKKNCIFSCFVFSKFAETKHDTSNYQTWINQTAILFLCLTFNVIESMAEASLLSKDELLTPDVDKVMRV